MAEVSKDTIRRLATEAAGKHRDKGRPLTSAVVDVVRDRGLTTEQTKRVVEETNVVAHLDAFGRAGPKKNVVFTGGPADPEAVLRETSGVGTTRLPSEPTPASASMGPAASVEKTASVRALRPVETMSKATIEPKVSLEVQYDLLTKQASMICDRANRLESAYEECCQQMVGAVKLALASNVSEGAVQTAIHRSAATPWGANLAVYELARRTGIECPPVKVAGRLVDDHPLVLSVLALEKTAADLKVHREARRAVENDINTFLTTLVPVGANHG